jgi:seryl-tRNA synthetase
MSGEHPISPELDQIKKEFNMIKYNAQCIKKYHKEVKAGTREAKPAEVAEMANLLDAMISHQQELHDRLQKQKEVSDKINKDMEDPTKALCLLIADLRDKKHDINDPATKQTIHETYNNFANALCDVYKESTGAISRQFVDLLRKSRTLKPLRMLPRHHLILQAPERL